MKYIYIKFSFLLCLMLVIIPCSNTFASSDKNIAIVYKESSSLHRKILSSIQNSIQESKQGNIYLKTLSIERVNQKRVLANYDLVVTIGTAPAAKIMALDTETPILNIAIPRLSLEQLKLKYNRESQKLNTKNSAIYLDQPVKRKFDLIQTILPKAKHVGIVMGPVPMPYKTGIKNDVQTEIKNREMKVHTYDIKNESEIIDAVDKVLENSDVLLGHIDQLVFNRKSARNILLTAYRWKVPVIGISPGYVRAGALACVYSTPQQIGEHAAETITTFVYNSSTTLGKPQFPKYFSVSVNYQVAEAMGIYLKTEEQIKNAILRARRDKSWSE